MTSAETSLMITLVRRKDRPACLLLPGAGGGLVHYFGLASHLGLGYNVYGVRPVGLLAGERPQDTVPAMVDSVLRELDRAELVPELVFGWSLGGLLAWETCVRLADRGHRPRLMLVDSSPLARVSTVDDDRRIEELIVQQLGPKAAPEARDRVARVFRGQVAALNEYRTTREYDADVLLLRCTAPGAGIPDDAVRRWSELAPNLTTVSLRAGHFDVFDPEHAPALSEAVDGFLGAHQKHLADGELGRSPILPASGRNTR